MNLDLSRLEASPVNGQVGFAGNVDSPFEIKAFLQ